MTVRPDSPRPHPFALELWSAGQGRRFTYFELDRDGRLAFAGGRMAAVRSARPVLTLSESQRDELWRLIAGSRLLEAEHHPFAEPREVVYEITITAGSRRRSLRTIDDEAPGARRLHDALFEIQADARFR